MYFVAERLTEIMLFVDKLNVFVAPALLSTVWHDMMMIIVLSGKHLIEISYAFFVWRAV